MISSYNEEDLGIRNGLLAELLIHLSICPRSSTGKAVTCCSTDHAVKIHVEFSLHDVNVLFNSITDSYLPAMTNLGPQTFD